MKIKDVYLIFNYHQTEFYVAKLIFGRVSKLKWKKTGKMKCPAILEMEEVRIVF